MKSRHSAKKTPFINKKQPHSNQGAKLRIIAGKWRSRQLPIPNLEGLRPTPDRVRETLFNWLAPYIAGANCADLFCGSGALGLEALSREAKHCTFVDASQLVTKQMQTNLATLGCNASHVIHGNSIDFLRANDINQQPNREKFDIVFIDPPFRKGWIEQTLPLLEQGWLNHQALVYLEMEKEMSAPKLNQQWQLLKEKQAGQLTYQLYQFRAIT